MYSNFDMVKEFHNEFDVPVIWEGWPPTGDMIKRRWSLLNEEYEELWQELFDYEDGKVVPALEPDKKKVAKEIADMLYVIYGMADVFGIPIDKVFEEVHSSNMSKLGTDGRPIRREDGKIMKGSNYKEPDLSWL